MVKSKLQKKPPPLNLLSAGPKNSLLGIFTEQTEYNTFIQLLSPIPNKAT